MICGPNASGAEKNVEEITRAATNWPKVGANAAQMEKLAAPKDEIKNESRTPYLLATGTQIKHLIDISTWFHKNNFHTRSTYPYSIGDKRTIDGVRQISERDVIIFGHLKERRPLFCTC